MLKKNLIKKKNYFKIGSSKDVVNSCNQRIVAIQIGNPRKLFLLKKIYNENSLNDLIRMERIKRFIETQFWLFYSSYWIKYLPEQGDCE